MSKTKVNSKSDHTARDILLLITLLIAILLLLIGNNNLVSADSISVHEATTVEVDKEAFSNYGMLSPAKALSNGKPTLFFFYPVDTCRIRYCRQPGEIASKLEDHFGKRVNFVAVALDTMTYGPDPNSSPHYPLVNWDLYPVEPYSDWLPGVVYQAGENDLPAGSVVLVDADGEMVYHDSEFFSWVEIEPYIDRLIENRNFIY